MRRLRQTQRAAARRERRGCGDLRRGASLGACSALVALAVVALGPADAAECPPLNLLSDDQRCFTTERGTTYRTLTSGDRWKVYTISETSHAGEEDAVCVGENWSEDEGERIELSAVTLPGQPGRGSLTLWFLEIGSERVDLTTRSLGELASSGIARAEGSRYELSEPRAFIAAWLRCAARVQAATPGVAR